jgi:hypothetical protein
MCALCGRRRCPLTRTSVREFGMDGICFCGVPLMVIDKLEMESNE